MRFLKALLPFSILHADPVTYPDSHPTELTETIHGTSISDPYRWLEDLNSKQTHEWIAAQTKLTESYLDAIPGRDSLKTHLTKLWNVERYGTPFKEGEHYFYSKNDGLQNQSVLYTSSSLQEEGRILLDPNTISADGTVALKSYQISPDGKHMAYSLAQSGSDWIEWKVKHIASGKDLTDHIKWSKFSGAAWSKDGKGFYYGRFPTPKEGEEMMAQNVHKKIYYHLLGTPQSADTLIYERPQKPKQGLYASVSEDGKYLLINVSQGTDPKNGLFYKDLTQPDAEVVELFNQFDASYSYISNEGSTFLVQTDLNAPKQRVISVDLADPTKLTTIIPESQETLRSVSHIGGILIASYLKDAHSEVRRFQTDGKALPPIKLPGLGTTYGFSGKSDADETFYSFSSFTTPGTIYHYDPKTNTSRLFKQPKTQFDPSHYEIHQKFYPSTDGTKIPMFLVHKKGLQLNGKNPTYLYGYGGFNISVLPRYSPATIAWLDQGGIWAVVNLRGGSEYGEEWHLDGMLHRKQNVFEDFISAAEYLIDQKYTSSKKIAIAGGSNGGLLVGACMTQRPDLFGACLPAVGVMDMLRFHKFTIGWAWQPEYGYPDENVADFHYLRRYSPYHNLLKGTHYPATLVTTSDHDDRVVPSHSYKFAAALQAAQAGEQPTLIRIETKSGHGAGTPTSKQIEQVVDKYSFLSKTLGFEIKQ